MTRRMVRAASGGQADVLGHCTGRLVEGNRGTRPESKFDPEKVFTACRDHGTAVEINSRPERRDPPTRLLKLALEIGCDFSIDTDAHAPGQLDFLGYGAQRAIDNGVPVAAGVDRRTALAKPQRGSQRAGRGERRGLIPLAKHRQMHVVGTRRTQLPCVFGDLVGASPRDQRIDQSVTQGGDVVVGKALPAQ
jgi:hypothetical protein